MDTIETLMSRNSVPPKLLSEPAPSEDALREILDTAVRAPDHGAIHPWRFHIVRGEARAQLSEIFVEALLKRDPDAPEAAITKERNRTRFAPIIIVACAKVTTDHPTVPVVEQIVSTGAAIQNIMNAAHAKGFGSFLSTGKNAQDPHVKQAFDLTNEDEIVGFVYLGTPKPGLSAKPRPDVMDFCSEWTGPVSAAAAE
jgi:nitroreductase